MAGFLRCTRRAGLFSSAVRRASRRVSATDASAATTTVPVDAEGADAAPARPVSKSKRPVRDMP